MNLTEFLRARIAEDEAVARGAADDGYGAIDWAGESGPTDVHIARHDPARVLAECKAKRRIVARLAPESRTTAQLVPVAALASDVLGLLALPYTDHPDYDESWHPQPQT